MIAEASSLESSAPSNMVGGGRRIGCRLPAVARGMLGRFGRDKRGVSAVEFGLVAVPFLGLMFGIFEVGFVFFNTTGLQSAVQTGARNLLTGNAQAASATVTTASQFNTTYICPALPSFIPCSSLVTDVRTATSFSSVDATSDFYNGTTLFCPGAPGQITIVRVAYPMPVFFPILVGSPVHQSTNGLISSQSGYKQLILATSVFQAEPYNISNYNKSAYVSPSNPCP